MGKSDVNYDENVESQSDAGIQFQPETSEMLGT
jgi:hypothetical protein